MRDNWTTYRFVIYDSWVVLDVTSLLASGPRPARFSAFDEPEVQFHVYRRLKRKKKKPIFFKKNFPVEISISRRSDLAN